ncbi:hypothetical protein MRV_0078 [Murid herpesvirus 3]|uniref:Protein UL87 n=2 Tax=Murid betaherpesvirus 3 TaxID=2560603 RepID=A0A1P8VIW0_9BETA|nr:hypothetical protein MRV_0078 [Murine roseolovirus]APZ76289.1 hypothetical protein MRV_0078 [Murid betaherpesvirus 3]AYH64719.1 hypothetical protein MRV_0078 [Murid herpesvirus 3]
MEDNCIRSIPVFLEECDLTHEISRDEDFRISQNVSINYDKIDDIIHCLFWAPCSPSMTEKDRAKLTLCRLLLGPATIPCSCEEWDVTDYLHECGYNCTGPILFLYKNNCKCRVNGTTFGYSLLKNYCGSHVIRGLLSLYEWNVNIPNLLCQCKIKHMDRYAATVLPKSKSIYLTYYPYFLCFLTKYLSVLEIEECMNNLIIYLGQNISQRVIIHYRLLFGFKKKISPDLVDVSIWDKFYTLEIQKMWLNVYKHNNITKDFFNSIFSKLQANKTEVIQIFKLPASKSPHINRLCISLFKKQLLYFNIKLNLKKNKKDHHANSFTYGKNVYIFDPAHIMWRNLFLVYYGYKMVRYNPNIEDINKKQYIKSIARLSLRRFRSDNVFFKIYKKDVDKDSVSNPGGIHFSEIMSVNYNDITLHAFNTNRVLNCKAALFNDNKTLYTMPKNMTHSFVMYKLTFKEPSCTISTFVSNDNIDTTSLNINVRGSYCDMIYTLLVYRLHVNVKDFFLPVHVCNSNSSMDMHGLENQESIRNRDKRIFWVTNFPCMLSNSATINVGWFKAGTANIPKVSGRELYNVILNELKYITEIPDLIFDKELHNILTIIEKRNVHQIPFLTKQFLIFLRLSMCIKCKASQATIDRYIKGLVNKGIFDYNKNSISNTKIKHACALVGTRLSNNVPKIMSKHKKLKLDHLGRNANSFAVLKFIIINDLVKNKNIISEILNYIKRTSQSKKIQKEIEWMLKALNS